MQAARTAEGDERELAGHPAALHRDDSQRAEHRLVDVGAVALALTGQRAEAVYGRTRWELHPDGASEAEWAAHRAELDARRPFRGFEMAVRGMLPKGALGRAQLLKLKVYAGPEHPHAAQMPQPFQITQVAQ